MLAFFTFLAILSAFLLRCAKRRQPKRGTRKSHREKKQGGVANPVKVEMLTAFRPPFQILCRTRSPSLLKPLEMEFARLLVGAGIPNRFLSISSCAKSRVSSFESTCFLAYERTGVWMALSSRLPASINSPLPENLSSPLQANVGSPKEGQGRGPFDRYVKD